MSGLLRILLPAMLVSAVASEPLIHTLLSPKWTEAARIYSYMAPAVAVQTLIALSNPVLLALGRPRVQMRCTLEYMILWVPVLLIFVHYGLAVAAIAYSVVLMLYNFRQIIMALDIFQISWLSYIQALAPAIFASSVAVLTYVVFDYYIDWSDVASAGVAVLLALLTTGIGFLLDLKTLKAAFAA